ncbi:MAG: hypothetical protein IPO08_22485 [Xanthomonadales bacterium]|nr:hypothetical protein [Xanthomonadales bacterium]
MNSDNRMAESEAIEWGIEIAYTELQIKRHEYEQLTDSKRRADSAEYDAEQQQHAQNYQAMERERKQRSALVKANGGKCIELPGGRIIDTDGSIIYSSDLRG